MVSIRCCDGFHMMGIIRPNGQQEKKEQSHTHSLFVVRALSLRRSVGWKEDVACGEKIGRKWELPRLAKSARSGQEE